MSELFGLSEVFFPYLPGTEPFHWYDSLTYYTNLSNIVLLIGSITAWTNDILSLRKKERKIVFSIFKYMGVVISMVTCVTVYFFVIHTGEILYGIFVEGNMWLLLHTINPLLGLLSYLFFDQHFLLKKKTILIPVIFTVIYTIMIEIICLGGGRVPISNCRRCNPFFSEDPRKWRNKDCCDLCLICSYLIHTQPSDKKT